MSLYARLLALSAGHVRTEDALTEVVAHVLRLDAAARGPDVSVVVTWLRSLDVLSAGAVTTVRIDTQRTYPAVTLGDPSSRPDLVIEVDQTGGARGVTFVESKVDSGEGDGQLARYAHTLAEAHPGGTLLYLTRDPDAKPDGDVLVGLGLGAVTFRQARWHGVYRAVRDARASAPVAMGALYDDLLSFFRHLGMDHDPRFTPADAVALNRIPRTLRFLEATLWDGAPSPAERFREVLGGVNRKDAGLSRIRDHARYTLYRKYGGADARFEVLLGYTFERDGFPGLKLEIGALASSGGASRVAESIRGLDGRTAAGVDRAWRAYTAAEANWSGALVWVPLETLLGESDHEAAIRRTFLALLDELADVVSAKPDLPWDAPEAAEPS